MPIAVSCGSCGANYQLKDELAGLTLRCRKCQATFKVPDLAIQESGPAPAPVVAGGPPPLPVSRRRDDDDDDDRHDDDDHLDERRRPHDEDLDPAFDRDKFLLRQQHWSFHEKYYVNDDKGRNIMFVERPVYYMQSCLAVMAGMFVMLIVVAVFVGLGFALRRGADQRAGEAILAGLVVLGFVVGIIVMLVILVWLMPKRHIQFYTDDSKDVLLLEILQDKKWMPINATYTVIDADGNLLARFRKNHLYNFFRRRWYGYHPDGELMLMALEDSLLISVLRRVLPPIIAVFMRTNFIITGSDGEKLLGEFNRKYTLLDRYVLDMSRDYRGEIDRRVAVALGVLLDTGERR